MAKGCGHDVLYGDSRKPEETEDVEDGSRGIYGVEGVFSRHPVKTADLEDLVSAVVNYSVRLSGSAIPTCSYEAHESSISSYQSKHRLQSQTKLQAPGTYKNHTICSSYHEVGMRRFCLGILAVCLVIRHLSSPLAYSAEIALRCWCPARCPSVQSTK
jgi:hypothetical protein